MTNTPKAELERLGVGRLAGLRVVSDVNLTDIAEDWSAVRSPSRAIRRRKRGHRQNIRFHLKPRPTFYRIGDMIVAHPEMVARLSAHLQEQSS